MFQKQELFIRQFFIVQGNGLVFFLCDQTPDVLHVFPADGTAPADLMRTGNEFSGRKLPVLEQILIDVIRFTESVNA